MLKIKGWLRAAALCVAFCLLLTGCSIPMQEETVQVEELLRAPRLAGDYGALQTALNDWLGESAQLKYPLQGDLLSPFVLQDFDGDGEQDAAVFYTTALTSNVCVAFLRKNSGGAWQVSQTVEAWPIRWTMSGWLSFRRAARPSSSWAMRLRRMTTIWPFTPMRTVRCRLSLSRHMSSTSWRTSPAAAAKTLS